MTITTWSQQVSRSACLGQGPTIRLSAHAPRGRARVCRLHHWDVGDDRPVLRDLQRA